MQFTVPANSIIHEILSEGSVPEMSIAFPATDANGLVHEHHVHLVLNKDGMLVVTKPEGMGLYLHNVMSQFNQECIEAAAELDEVYYSDVRDKQRSTDNAVNCNEMKKKFQGRRNWYE